MLTALLCSEISLLAISLACASVGERKNHRRAVVCAILHRFAPVKFFGDNSGELTLCALPNGYAQSDECITIPNTPDYDFVLLPIPLETNIYLQFSMIP